MIQLLSYTLYSRISLKHSERAALQYLDALDIVFSEVLLPNYMDANASLRPVLLRSRYGASPRLATRSPARASS
jgi:hypothetical protein